jgi:hypothetical protein
MFLHAGAVLEPSWLDEAGRFINDGELSRAAPIAAVFRKSVSARSRHPAILEALMLLKFGLLRQVHPEQGLLIERRLYKEIGGHREKVADPEADLLVRLGRRRIVMLRSGVRS